MKVGGDIKETSMEDADGIKVDLEKIILMLKEQKNVIPTQMLKLENVNEDVELHEHIDGGDILNLIYYDLFPTHPFKWRRWAEVFLSNLWLQYSL